MNRLASRVGIPITILVGWGMLLVNPAGADYEGDASIGGGTVQGRVTMRGSVPPADKIAVHRDLAFCGETIPNDALLVDRASKGIAGVVVSLEGVARGKPLAPAPTPLDNNACRFSPRVGATAAGSQLEITNGDPVLHNTHIFKDRSTFLNVALPSGRKAIRKPLPSAGRLDVRCDAHKFMQSTMHVFAHPYFAVTDDTGQFELTRVPPGTYQLRVWHETLGTQVMTVQVPAKGAVTVSPVLDAPR